MSESNVPVASKDRKNRNVWNRAGVSLPRLVLVLPFLLLGVNPGWAQQQQKQQAPPRITFTLGAGYDQGDFGLQELSKASYIPFSLRYSASERFEIGVSSAVARIDSPGGVELIDGIPTRTGTSGIPLRETGMTDTTVRTRFFLLLDEGPGASTMTLTPFFKVKIPTADADVGLGTGKTDYGLGVEWDKTLASAFLFGDVGYTVVGKIRRLGLRNRPSASIGLGKQLAEAVTVSGILDWRRAIIEGNSDPAEFTGVISFRMAPGVTVSPNAFVGLTDGTSDYGVGLQLTFKFGRF